MFCFPLLTESANVINYVSTQYNCWITHEFAKWAVDIEVIFQLCHLRHPITRAKRSFSRGWGSIANTAFICQKERAYCQVLRSYSLLLKLYVQRTVVNFLLIPSSVLRNDVTQALVLIKMNDIIYGIPHKHSFLPLHAYHEGDILIGFYWALLMCSGRDGPHCSQPKAIFQSQIRNL